MIKGICCLLLLTTCFCATAQIDIDFLKQNDIPVILANGQVNSGYKNELVLTAVAEARIKTISVKETGTFPRMSVYGFEQQKPDSALLFEFEKDGKLKRVFPEGAVVTYNRRRQPVSYNYIEKITEGCATGGFVHSSYHRYTDLFYKKKRLVKAVSGTIRHTEKTKGTITLYNEVKAKDAVFYEKVSYLSHDTLTKTTCIFYNPKRSVKSEFTLRNKVGVNQYKVLKGIEDSLLHYLMTNPWGVWQDSAFIAYNYHLSDSLEQQDRYEDYYDYETAIQNVNDSMVELYNELAENYTGYLYDKNGLLTLSGTFKNEDPQKVDKYVYDNNRLVIQWDTWHFWDEYKHGSRPYGLDYYREDYKISRYYQYDTKGRVQKCFLYVFTFLVNDYEEEFSYNSNPYCLEYAFEYDSKNRVSSMTVTDLQKKKGLTTYPFIFEYTRY